jgi:DNA invertase Pin-like site-specific DNA recombinase
MADTRGHDLASPTIRAGIFSRESKGKGSSIEDQDRENHEACEGLGAEVVAKLHDKVSASRFGRKARDGWPQIMEMVRSGQLDVLILWEISRGDRTMDTWVPFVSACRDAGVLIHVTSAETTYDPRKGSHRKALLDAGSDAEHETEKLSARTRKGTAGAALAGKGHGPAGYGFTRIYDAHDRKKFTQVPNDNATVAEAIIERIARRDPLLRISTELNEAGIPSPGGGKWTPTGVRELAKNPAYAGFRDHKGTLHPANWKGLVPVATWRTAMAVLAEPDRRRAAPGARKWLLTGFAVGACDEPVHARPGKGVRSDLYLCRDGCIAVAVADLDEWILRLIARRLSQPDARDLFKSDGAETQRALDEVALIQLELDDLEAQLKKGPNNGGISATLAASVEPDIRKRLTAAQARAKAVSSHGAALALLGSGEATTEKDIRERWGDLSVAGRWSVVTDLFELIKIGPALRRLTRHASTEARLKAAAERTKVRWA